MVMECEQLSMSLAPRDRQIHDRLAATGQEKAEERFRTALTEMLLAHARFRWGRIEAGPGECVTAGEILDGLVAVPPPSPAFSRLFPITARPLAGLSDSQPAPSPQP